MIASCPQCSMSLSFDDQRLPSEPFNVLCPRCRQSVTIMPPPKSEPRLPGSTGSLNAVQADAGAEPVRSFAEMLMSMMKGSSQAGVDLDKWQRRRVLLCLEDRKIRDVLRSSLDLTRYEIFSADFAAEAMETLHESRAEVLVLDPSFDPEHQGGSAMMQHVNTLTSQVRRRTYVVLISSQLRTLDTYLAFANNVNLTVHPDDAGSIQTILERSISDFNEVYRPFNQANAASPF